MQPQLRATTLLESELITGGQFPDLVLPTMTGERVRLHQILNHGAALVSFYWSDRCSYHDLGLWQLKRALPILQTLVKTLVIVSTQPPKNFFWITAHTSLNSVILQDCDRSSLKIFGVKTSKSPGSGSYAALAGSQQPEFKQLENSCETAPLLPTHATYVIAQDHTILYECVESNSNHCLNFQDCIKTLDSEYWLGLI